MTRKYVRKVAPLTAPLLDTVRVQPRPGYILAGIPATGADVPKALADEWIRNGLVVKVEER
jgi:hypothetical protein